MLILGYCPKCGYVFSGDEEVDVNNFNDYGVLRGCYGTPFCYYYLCVLQSFCAYPQRRRVPTYCEQRTGYSLII